VLSSSLPLAPYAPIVGLSHRRLLFYLSCPRTVKESPRSRRVQPKSATYPFPPLSRIEAFPGGPLLFSLAPPLPLSALQRPAIFPGTRTAQGLGTPPLVKLALLTYSRCTASGSSGGFSRVWPPKLTRSPSRRPTCPSSASGANSPFKTTAPTEAPPFFSSDSVS